MTRRSAVIAAVAMFAGNNRTGAAQSGSDGRRYLTLSLDPIKNSATAITADWEATQRARAANQISDYVIITKPPAPPMPIGLEIQYGSRVVRLTPEEIMDALEGK